MFTMAMTAILKMSNPKYTSKGSFLRSFLKGFFRNIYKKKKKKNLKKNRKINYSYPNIWKHPICPYGEVFFLFVVDF